jgi:hypothetical protein
MEQGVMRAKWFLAVVGLLGLTGCSTPAAVGGHEAYGVTMAQAEGVRVGEIRVVDGRINPLVPVHTTIEGDVISVRYAHPRTAGALAHLDSQSLTPVAPEEQVAAERPTSPATGAVRVVLHRGRFIECWRQGNSEQGYRLMAQAWTAAGQRIGQPVPISPPEADVMVAPQMVSLDGERVVATFVATSGERFALLAVSLEILP